MKKLYKKGTVHPTPPLVSDQLSFLPAAILTLAAALSPQDREVLAYLISCSSTNFSANKRTAHKNKASSSKAIPDHPPSFNCPCFSCYMSYWVRWDSSPNRQLIHEIIDAFEDEISLQSKKEKSKRERRKNKSSGGATEGKRSELSSTKEDLRESETLEKTVNSSSGGGGGGGGGAGDGSEDGDREEELDKGSVRRFVSFLGERIWSVWS